MVGLALFSVFFVCSYKVFEMNIRIWFVYMLSVFNLINFAHVIHRSWLINWFQSVWNSEIEQWPVSCFFLFCWLMTALVIQFDNTDINMIHTVMIVSKLLFWYMWCIVCCKASSFNLYIVCDMYFKWSILYLNKRTYLICLEQWIGCILFGWTMFWKVSVCVHRFW
jgi:hypothetical protein